MQTTTDVASGTQPDKVLAGRVIPPSEHPITIDRISRDALFVMRKLNKAGFSAYLVGGGVRDLYLDKEPKDFDISTNARPGQLKKLFPNSRAIGRRFRLVQVFCKNGNAIEVSTLRSLSEHDLDGPEAVLAPNNTFGSLDEDAQRRDLTINSLFYEIKTNTIIDYVNGVEDLDKAIIRIVGNPDKRINRDPVRAIRAIRHAARNGFTIEDNSWHAICSNHNKLLLCPPSRLRDETLKDIYSGASAAWFELAAQSGIFNDLFGIYRKYLYSPVDQSTSCKDQLSSIFSTIDRINSVAVSNKGSRQPDFFMLALILIPWAEAKYGIFTEKLKGPALFQTGKRIRSDIDRDLGVQLNLRRSLRQDITTLLTNLSSLIHHRQNGTWPKWLRKKSYFKRCSLFYHCYIEAISGQHVDDEILYTPHKPHKEPKRPDSKSDSSASNKPAFAPTSRKGIFGFKK
ncbi:polya polymerase [Desulfosediminicola flagellatus]|uniref:polya polymerase n=1 Tax=Desulfosediminicola flagellatus TaxID=2569541 RepID=UPI0010AB7627|nr:polya polymerase [Desulfosediminicola flagellatus]